MTAPFRPRRARLRRRPAVLGRRAERRRVPASAGSTRSMTASPGRSGSGRGRRPDPRRRRLLAAGRGPRAARRSITGTSRRSTPRPLTSSRSARATPSRLFRTTDGGATWTVVLANPDPAGFLDAIAFRDARRGLVLGDPVDGRFALLRTDDGGDSWERVGPDAMPPALPGEAAFAASGSCLVVLGDDHAWFCTGGGAGRPRLPLGRRRPSWTAHPLPIPAGSPSCRRLRPGLPRPRPRRRRRRRLRAARRPRPRRRPDRPTAGPDLAIAGGAGTGRLSIGRRLRPRATAALVAVGPTGTDASSDGGESWEPIGVTGFHAVDATWAVGDDGRVARLMIGPRPTGGSSMIVVVLAIPSAPRCAGLRRRRSPACADVSGRKCLRDQPFEDRAALVSSAVRRSRCAG